MFETQTPYGSARTGIHCPDESLAFKIVGTVQKQYTAKTNLDICSIEIQRSVSIIESKKKQQFTAHHLLAANPPIIGKMITTYLQYTLDFTTIQDKHLCICYAQSLSK